MAKGRFNVGEGTRAEAQMRGRGKKYFGPVGILLKKGASGESLGGRPLRPKKLLVSALGRYLMPSSEPTNSDG